MVKPYPRVARLRNAEAFGQHIETLGITLDFDGELPGGQHNALAQTYTLPSGRRIGNRFCTLPMEGWDGTSDGKPTEETFRRWRNFGKSGAKLIWGGEAVAVRHDGRANPNQLVIGDHTLLELEQLRKTLVEEHSANHGSTKDLFVGLQLTHSGRFSRPNKKTVLEPMIAYHHPLVDNIFNLAEDYPVATDDQIEELIAEFVRAAKQAQELGFDFIDIKHCHGYFGHELLSAFTRPGKYGGSFENRSRFLREIAAGVQRECPGLVMGMRVSAFDFPPFREDQDGIARPLEYRDDSGKYPYAFGSDPEEPTRIDLRETVALLKLAQSINIELVCLSAGSPYYNPHLTRPAFFPPSDGYAPPEDPLVGVARQVSVVAELKSQIPDLALVGSGYSYLQEWLPNVAHNAVRSGKTDFVGLGRMILAYPEMPADILSGAELSRKRICRTFSDCTTAPRKGMISGCYPLDEYYKQKPEAEKIKQIKAEIRN
jgi:2,4-dienoyl-CoA reductase-like NADH-dependent reductase (Old Yellow Enzyme family)